MLGAQVQVEGSDVQLVVTVSRNVTNEYDPKGKSAETATGGSAFAGVGCGALGPVLDPVPAGCVSPFDVVVDEEGLFWLD